jgi:uncharacterized protein YdcH (DUF465 family)
MNANELAVYMEDITDSEESPYRQAATMLRQQQARLEKSQELLREYTALHMKQQAEIQKLKEENAELQRLFDRAMDEWAKDRNK